MLAVAAEIVKKNNLLFKRASFGKYNCFGR